MATAPLTITVARSYDEFLAMAPAWSELYAQAERPLPFLHHGWLRLCWQLRRSAFKRPRAIMMHEAGRPVMAVAVAFGWRRLMPQMLFLGSGTPQYSDALWVKSERTLEHAEAMLEALARQPGAPRRLWARDWPVDSPFRSVAIGWPTIERRQYATFQVALTDFPDWDTYFHRRGKQMRGDHRRRLRRLEEQRGKVTFVVEQGEARRQTLHWLMTAKSEWAERTGHKTPWLKDGSGERFLTAVLELPDGPESLVATLRCDDRIVAAVFCLRGGDALYVSKIAHDPSFAAYSPGRSLLMMLMELAFAEGIALVDLMAGGVEWKHRFATGQSALVMQKVRLR